MKTSTLSGLVKKDLKKNFPKVKFRVRTRGDASMRVSWEDGPQNDEVDKLLRKYEM